MKTVAKIIESFGGLDWLIDNYIRLENPPYMRLVIERTGEGPRGFPAVSVAHYYEQNGDAMRDPEIVFELDGKDWCPISFRQDNMGVYQEAISVGDSGQVMIRADLVKDLRSFARHWDRNLAAQGFLRVAEEAAK